MREPREHSTPGQGAAVCFLDNLVACTCEGLGTKTQQWWLMIADSICRIQLVRYVIIAS